MEKFRWMAAILVAINVAIFILQVIFPWITDSFLLQSSTYLSEPWRIMTHMFLHGSFQHLFYNMFGLFMFGLILEKLIGSRRFLIAYFIGGLFASFGAAFFYNATLGASGALYAVFGTLAMIRPKMVVYVGFAPMPMIVAVVLWAAGDLLGMFAPGQVAYAAHLAGLAFGIVYGFILRGRYSSSETKRRNLKINESDFKKWEDRWM